MLSFLNGVSHSLVFLAPGREPLSYQECSQHIANIARQFRAVGLARRDRVVLLIPSGPEAASAFLAVSRVCQCAPLNPAYRAAELDTYFEALRPSLILQLGGDPLPSAERLGIPVANIVVDDGAPAGVFRLPTLPVGTCDPEPPDLSDVALLLHTSGTTARPKLAHISWQTLLRYTVAHGGILQLTPADRCLSFMPMFHAHGLKSGMLAATRSGGSVICTPPFEAASFFEWMDGFDPTWYTAVPTIHQAILARAPLHPESLKRSKIRCIRSSSAILQPSIALALEQTFGAPVCDGYGSTECPQTLASGLLPPHPRKQGSVGKPLIPELAVLDNEGNLAGPNVQGEICVRAEAVDPYVDNDEANREAFRGAWFHTGDLGRLDEDGFLFITGRVKEFLNRGGEKIAPAEVDGALLSHPAVLQCMTFALPDSRLGDEVGALVVRCPGAAVDEAELQDCVAAQLADFKIPRRVWFVDEIPKSPTGKPRRIGLAERLGITADSWKQAPDAAAGGETGVTSRVASLMAELLHIPEVGPSESFFELGGDSLLAHRLIARLQAHLGATVRIVDLFRGPSAAAIAAKLANAAVSRNSTAPSPGVCETAPLQLSAGQVRMWFLNQYEVESLAYVRPKLLEISGALDAETLRKCLVTIIERHQPLHTLIRLADGLPTPSLRSAEPFSMPLYDWTHAPAGRRESSAREIGAREASRPFRFDSDLMIRASLHRMDTGRFWLLLTMHHAAIDGWSIQLILSELRALLAGETLPPLPATYSSFAEWQDRLLDGERLDSLLDYWRANLKELPPLLDLPHDLPRPLRQTYTGNCAVATLPSSLSARLRQLSRQSRATLFMTLLAAWKCLLARYAGTTDICVGAPEAGRGRVEFERLAGFFVNTLVLRTNLEGNPSFAEILSRVRDTCLGAWDHAALPFERLVEALHQERSAAYTPFFQVFFQLRNFPRSAQTAGGLQLIEREFELDSVLTDLHLDMTEAPEGLECRLYYNTSLFSERYAGALLEHFGVLLQGIAESPEARLSQLPLLTERERTALLERGLSLSRPLALRTLTERFERQARERPNEPAILHEDRRVTYGELNAQANRLARLFSASGVGPGQIAAICMDRSPEWIAAALGVLKTGAAYLPLDPANPRVRLQELIRESGCVFLAADEHCLEKLRSVALPQLWKHEWKARLTNLDDADPPLASTPESPAYILFTSGSTGRPKAVVIEQRNVCAFLSGFHWTSFSPEETYLHVTNVTFDLSALEIWGPLTEGGRCAVFSAGVSDPVNLGEWIRRAGVTCCYFSGSVFNTLIDEAPEVLRPIRRILVGGEALSPSHIRRALDLLPQSELVNGYGPTESTIFCTGYRIPRRLDPILSSIPIGKPVDNACVYIVDASGQLVSDGLPGELWVAGDLVGRGYLDQPELTERAFLPNPFPGVGAPRVYRTGDRARWLPSGEIEFLGRADRQVKVRGVRIDLGEIESVIESHPAVAQCAVVTSPDAASGSRLTAFAAGGASLSPSALEEFLRARLPAQLVPQHIRVVQSLPVNASGKLDRRALQSMAAESAPSPVSPVEEQSAPAASPTLEKQLAGIWSRLLGVNGIAPEDDFFGLGGHSLLAVRLAFQIEKQFGQKLDLVTLFESPTLRRMAALLEPERKTPPSRRKLIIPIEPEGDLPPILCVGAGPLFRPLAAALSARVPFCSVRHPSWDQSDLDTIEKLAAAIAPEVLDTYAGRPVVLSGWCLAGVLALETAHQLERVGQPVAAVVLFDTLSPVKRREWFRPAPSLRQWQLNFRKAGYHVRDSWSDGLIRVPSFLLKKFREARDRAEYDRLHRQACSAADGLPDLPLDFEKTYGLLTARYTPRPVRAPIFQCLPERNMGGALYAGDRGWSELGYRVKIMTAPGDHREMLLGANAKILARKLIDHIESLV